MSEALVTGKLKLNLIDQQLSQPQFKFANTDFDDIIKSAEFLKNLFPSWVFVLCKLHHPHTPFFSENSQAILGYTADYLKRLSLEEYFNLIHPEDAKGVRLLYEYIRSWFKNAPEREHQDYRFVLHYRFRSAQQKYLYLQNEENAYQNKSGHYVFFSLLKNIQEPFSQVKLEVFQRSNNDFRKVNEYTPRLEKQQPITSREKEILQGIQQGLTSKQIAERLSVSVYTVRNHRSNIFEKSRAQNMVQLVKMAEASGWI